MHPYNKNTVTKYYQIPLIVQMIGHLNEYIRPKRLLKVLFISATRPQPTTELVGVEAPSAVAITARLRWAEASEV